MRKALTEHKARQVDAGRPYSTSFDELVAAYYAALRRLRKRFPKLDHTDPRAELEQ